VPEGESVARYRTRDVPVSNGEGGGP
jgi:hypothetical protein